MLALSALAGFAILLEAPLCPTATLLGIPCPGCGLTRATFALLHGDLHGALRLHPLSPLLTPLFVGALLTAALGYIAGPERRLPRLPIPRRFVTPIGWALFALVFGVWLSRFFGAFGGPVPVRSIRAAPFHALVSPSAPSEPPARATR